MKIFKGKKGRFFIPPLAFAVLMVIILILIIAFVEPVRAVAYAILDKIFG